MKKVFGGFLGVIIGSGSWAVVKYTILLSGPFVLGPMWISDSKAARNLEALAEILGFIVFFIVLTKIYRAIVNKNNKSKSIGSVNKEVKKS